MHIVIETADNGYIILSKDYPARRLIATDKDNLKQLLTQIIDENGTN